MPLNVKEIEAAKFGVQKERLGDGSGMFLRLYPSGRKSFQTLVPKNATDRARVWITLGDFPDLTLKAARRHAAIVKSLSEDGLTAAQIRSRLKDGAITEPSQSMVPEQNVTPAREGNVTFETVAKTWFERKRTGLRNGKHVDQNWNTIETYVLPTLGKRAIASIDILEIVELFRPIWHNKHTTARRTLARTREIFEVAKLQHGLKSNPAIFDFGTAYGKVRRSKRHFGALRYEDVPAFWDWLQDADCLDLSRGLLSLIILTAKRTNETRRAEWSFFNADFSVWETPPELMKMDRSHRVPLSRQARMVLENMQVLTGDQQHVFARPNNRDGVMSSNTPRKLAKRFHLEITGHGFRSSFRTWARNRRIYSKDAMEFSLAHEPAALEAAYQRADLLEERAELMQDWADYVTGGKAPRCLRDSLKLSEPK